MSDKCFETLQERLRYLAQVAKQDVMRNALNAGADEIESLQARIEADEVLHQEDIKQGQARIEQLEPFERLAKMSGQNIGLRLMDAEARIEELETDIMAYKKHFGQPVGSDSRETWKEKYKKAQARIAELEEIEECALMCGCWRPPEE